MRCAVLVLLAGCYLGKSGKDCDPGPFFEGPRLTSPHVAAAGARSLVAWGWSDGDDATVQDHTYRGVLLDVDGTPLPETRFELDPDQRVYAAISGVDRALLLGEVAPAGRFAELRDQNGARIMRIDNGPLTGGGVLEGDQFLVYASGGLVRMAMDGTVGAPIALPGSGHGTLAVSQTVTWVVYKEEQTVTTVRIARGGGLLDATPRLVSSAAYFAVVAARGSEAVVVTRARDVNSDGVRPTAFHRLDPNGTIGAAQPLNLDVEPHLLPRWLTPESGGYLLLLEDIGTSQIMGVRLTSDGVPGPSFLVFDHAVASSLVISAGVDRNVFLYGPTTRMRGEPPRIEAVTIPAGQGPSPEILVETVEGRSYTVDCGW